MTTDAKLSELVANQKNIVKSRWEIGVDGSICYYYEIDEILLDRIVEALSEAESTAEAMQKERAALRAVTD
jgi:hypothetical protein